MQEHLRSSLQASTFSFGTRPQYHLEIVLLTGPCCSCSFAGRVHECEFAESRAVTNSDSNRHVADNAWLLKTCSGRLVGTGLLFDAALLSVCIGSHVRSSALEFLIRGCSGPVHI